MMHRNSLLSVIFLTLLAGCAEVSSGIIDKPMCDGMVDCKEEPSCEENGDCEEEPSCEESGDCKEEPSCEENGDCKEEPSCEETGDCENDCDDECEDGSYYCKSNDLMTCVRQKDGCWKYRVLQTCHTNQKCDADQVACLNIDEPCESECQLDQMTCLIKHVAKCVAQKNGCTKYEIIEECGDSMICDENSFTCIRLESCQDECQLGETKCSGDKISVCEKKQQAKCTTWSEPVNDIEGKSCTPNVVDDDAKCDSSNPASVFVVVDNDKTLYLRHDHNDSSNIIKQLVNGACVIRIDTVNYSGDGCNSGATDYYWYKVKYKDYEGYICSRFTSAPGVDESHVVQEPEETREDLIAKISVDSKYPVKTSLKKYNLYLSKFCASTGKCISYWVYLPEKFYKNMPMIMYLHGLSRRGDDYTDGEAKVISYGFGTMIKSKGAVYDAVIMMPQVPDGGTVYDYPTTFVELADKLAERFYIDKKRISALGFSHGCYGVTRKLVKTYPEYFSAAVAMGCANKVKDTYANTSAFRTTPLWTFVGESADSEGAVLCESKYEQTLQYFSEQVNANGGNAKHTPLEGMGHSIIDTVLRDKNFKVVDWLLSHRRE